MAPRLLVAAHGTHSSIGLATTQSLVAAVASSRTTAEVSLCFLDVAAPSLGEALAAIGDEPVVVVPLLLSAGYHVLTDIPALVADRPGVIVARHLGPDPAIITTVAARLGEVSPGGGRSTVLAAIASSQESARSEVATAADLLGQTLGRPVSVLPLSSDLGSALDGLAAPIEVAVYLLAEGGFLSALRTALAGRGVVAAPLGVHPALVSLVWARYDEAVNAAAAVR